MTKMEENHIIHTYSKKRIIYQEFDSELQNVSFAVVEFTIKTGKKQWKIKKIKDTVIKYYNNDKNGTIELLNEIKILNFINTEIQNDNLRVPEIFYYKFHKKRAHENFISRCPGKDLERWLNPYNNNNLKMSLDIIIQIAKGIQVLHHNNIAHRDIKPENIILNIVNGQTFIYFLDFAYSKLIKNNKFIEKKKYCGTPEYVSPELACGKEYNLFANDIWAFGILIYCLFTDSYLKIRQCNSLPEYMELCRYEVNEKCRNIDPKLKILLRKIFVIEKKRITIDEILDLLLC